jgi:hypothetical protein
MEKAPKQQAELPKNNVEIPKEQLEIAKDETERSDEQTMTRDRVTDTARIVLFILIFLILIAPAVAAWLLLLQQASRDLASFAALFSIVVTAVCFVLFVGHILRLIHLSGDLVKQLQRYLVSSVLASFVAFLVVVVRNAPPSFTQEVKTPQTRGPDDDLFHLTSGFFGRDSHAGVKTQQHLGRLHVNNLTADKVIYLRYITWDDQVQLDSYQGLRRTKDVGDDDSITLPVTFHHATGAKSQYLDYFKWKTGSSPDEIKHRTAKDNNYIFEINAGDIENMSTIKWYGHEGDPDADSFITPLFQFYSEAGAPNVDEYIIMNKDDHNIWNPNKYVFELTEDDEGRHTIDFSMQVYSEILMACEPDIKCERKSSKDVDARDLLKKALTVQCSGQDKCKAFNNAISMLRRAYDDRNDEFARDVVVFKATSPSRKDKERLMWFKLCPGAKGCPDL